MSCVSGGKRGAGMVRAANHAHAHPPRAWDNLHNRPGVHKDLTRVLTVYPPGISAAHDRNGACDTAMFCVLGVRLLEQSGVPACMLDLAFCR